MEFDPTVAKQRVRVRDDPAITGLTTGRTRRSGPIEFAEIEFGPNNRQFKPASALELVAESEDAVGLFARGTFGTPSDLRRLLTFIMPPIE